MKEYYFKPINISINGKEMMKKRPFAKNTRNNWLINYILEPT